MLHLESSCRAESGIEWLADIVSLSPVNLSCCCCVSRQCEALRPRAAERYAVCGVGRQGVLGHERHIVARVVSIVRHGIIAECGVGESIVCSQCQARCRLEDERRLQSVAAAAAGVYHHTSESCRREACYLLVVDIHEESRCVGLQTVVEEREVASQLIVE